MGKTGRQKQQEESFYEFFITIWKRAERKVLESARGSLNYN